MKISKKQYKLLKKISKNKTIKNKELNNLKYLLSIKCVERNTSNDITDEAGNLISTDEIYIITSYGEAVMYDFKATFYKWWIPVVISIGAFIVSVIALFRWFCIKNKYRKQKRCDWYP